jgi:signal transduction histidine kinase
MPNSLAFRLFASFALWTLLVLPVTAFFLIASFRNEVQLGFDYRLNQYLIYLIDRAYPEQGVEIGAPNLGEPLFSLPFSGLYWQIKPLSSEVGTLYKSESLVTETLKLPSELGIPPDERLIRQASIPGPDNQKLRIIEREVAFQDGELRKIFSFAVAVDTIEIEESVYDFRTTLIINLAILGAGLMLATFIQVRFGLWPLRDISKGLAAIRSGESDRLEGTLPQEIVPLQDELNALIQSNNRIIERARTHVGNLAHALKTPLSVIMNEASSENSEFARKVYEQAAMMRQQIDHHLNRARIAARVGVVGHVTAVRPALGALIGALEKIYKERALSIRLDCPDDVKFQGEKQDFEEMAGNLLDNACKWAATTIEISVKLEPSRGKTGRMLTLAVEDDGEGLSAEARAAVIKRGRRFDEKQPGSGLGLSIVTDLAELYEGKFYLEQSELGGLRAVLKLPAS